MPQRRCQVEHPSLNGSIRRLDIRIVPRISGGNRQTHDTTPRRLTPAPSYSPSHRRISSLLRLSAAFTPSLRASVPLCLRAFPYVRKIFFH